VLIAKRTITEILRERGQDQRADWVERDLPDEFELDQHYSLLQLLRIDAADLIGTRPESDRPA
jgi:hypothetical protein